MLRHLNQRILAFALVAVLAASPVWAVEISGDRAQIARYLKITPSPRHDHPARLETSIVTFRSGSNPGVEVALVGVVHVGEARYFKQLQSRMEDYDAVLFEWIGPRGSLPTPGVHSELADALKLETQTSVVRYDRRHFVHADMHEDEFLRAMGLPDVPAGAESKPPLSEFAVMLHRLGSTRARWEIARQVSEDTRILASPVVILERNQVALRVLEEQIKAGKRKIAIFYGAAHMPDFERHLTERFRMTPVHTAWFKAWDMSHE